MSLTKSESGFLISLISNINVKAANHDAAYIVGTVHSLLQKLPLMICEEDAPTPDAPVPATE